MIPAAVIISGDSFAGVKGGLWHLIDDFVSHRTAAVRVSLVMSDSWDVENGFGQGAVLSRFPFNVVVNGSAAEIKRVCNGIARTGRAGSTQVQILMYADDVVILSKDPTALQRALDAAAAWARSWRFNFALGPQKSAVMCFAPARMRDNRPLGQPAHPVCANICMLADRFSGESVLETPCKSLASSW